MMTTDTPAPEAPILMSCNKCGKDGLRGQRGVDAHWNLQCPDNPLRATLNARKAAGDATAMGVKTSRRGMSRRGFSTRLPTAMEQVRPRPGGLIGGPSAYFINPLGATIREALVIYPNGAPMVRNGSDRANSEMYQARQRRRGYEYIGPLLTESGVKSLVETIEKNRPDYVLDLKEQIFDVNLDIENSDRPEVRDNQRKRLLQLTRLLEQAQQPLDGAALVADFMDVVKAQKLASIPANIREAVILLAGDQTDQKISAMVAQLSGGKQVTGDDTVGGLTVTVSNAPDGDEF